MQLITDEAGTSPLSNLHDLPQSLEVYAAVVMFSLTNHFSSRTGKATNHLSYGHDTTIRLLLGLKSLKNSSATTLLIINAFSARYFPR